MTKKYYWAIAVAAAFVAGTMTTGGAVYASFDQCANNPPMGTSDGKPFLEIWAAICDLESQVANINTDDADSDPTNEIQTLEISERLSSPVTVSAGGFDSATAECEAGEQVTGGGFETLVGSNTLNADVRGIEADASNDAFVVLIQHAGHNTDDYQFVASALCAKIVNP
jgi:hypothetical protein